MGGQPTPWTLLHAGRAWIKLNPSESVPESLDQNAIVSLGANIGHPVHQVRRALEGLRSLSSRPLRISSLWKTAPINCPPESPPFINAIAILTPPDGMDALAFLEALQALERSAGRSRKGVPNEPRLLDLDLITFKDVQSHCSQLTLPHPRAHLRRFVLAPLAELTPLAIFPGTEKTMTEHLDALSDPVSSVVRLEND